MSVDLWRTFQRRGIKAAAEKAFRHVRSVFDDPHAFLKQVTGVIHVGANSGQERDLYAKHNLKVMWIEPHPQIFERLCQNIASVPDQIAVNHLVTDKDSAEYVFNVSSNEGLSSSILELAQQHKDIWPHVHYVSQMVLRSVSLDTLLAKMGDARLPYQALVMDTQGSELLVLKGSTRSLEQFRFIRTEAADFELYKGCARVDDLTNHLAPFGFKLIRRDKFAQSPRGGRCFDLLYQKC